MAELQSTCCLEGEGCSGITSSQGALPGEAAPPARAASSPSRIPGAHLGAEAVGCPLRVNLPGLGRETMHVSSRTPCSSLHAGWGKEV